MTDDNTKHPHTIQSLNVVNPNDKIAQLRAEMAKEPPTPGKLAEQTLIERAVEPDLSAEQKAIREKVIEVLKTVYDPEIPVDIYELGLIYEVNVAPDRSVHVKMTLTAPGCPVAGTLPPEVERKIEGIDEVKSARVELVWEPQWTKDRMSEAALLDLGLL